MKIRTFKKLEDDVYKVTLYTEDWSEGDVKLMEKFAEPEINIGGDFGASPVIFSLDDNLVLIKSDSPFNVSFDSRDTDPATAKAWANLWASEVADRIVAEVVVLRANTDGFTSEAVEEV
jgi:hypothetical protein